MRTSIPGFLDNFAAFSTAPRIVLPGVQAESKTRRGTRIVEADARNASLPRNAVASRRCIRQAIAAPRVPRLSLRHPARPPLLTGRIAAIRSIVYTYTPRLPQRNRPAPRPRQILLPCSACWHPNCILVALRFACDLLMRPLTALTNQHGEKNSSDFAETTVRGPLLNRRV